MSDDTPKDRLLASLACVVLGCLLAALAAWLWIGVGAAGQDDARFAHNERARAHVQVYALYLIPLAGLVTLAAAGLIGLAAWIALAGRRGKKRRRQPRSARPKPRQQRGPAPDPPTRDPPSAS